MHVMIWELLTVGTWSFWLLLVLTAVIMSECMDRNRLGLASAMALGTVGLLMLFSDMAPLSWILHHTAELVWYSAAYILIGIAWGTIKWFFWLREVRTVLQGVQLAGPQDFDRRWQHACQMRAWSVTIPPPISEHKTMVVGWMSLWPSSMIWTLMHDPVLWLWYWVYYNMGGFLQRISNRVFKDLTNG